jgi:hypothetical protein
VLSCVPLVDDKQLSVLLWSRLCSIESLVVVAVAARAAKRVSSGVMSYVKSFCAEDFEVSRWQLPFAGDIVLCHWLNPKKEREREKREKIDNRQNVHFKLQ